MTVRQGEAMYVYRYSDSSNPFDSPELISAKFVDNTGDTISQTYENGRVVSSYNETQKRMTEYEYDLANNSVKIINSDASTRIVNMGGDGKFGTADDFLTGGSAFNLQAAYQQYGSPAQTSANTETHTVETTNEQGQTITHTYENGVLVSSKNETTGSILNYSFNNQDNQVTLNLSDGRTVTVGLGQDRLYGTADDVLAGISAFNLQVAYQQYGSP